MIPLKNKVNVNAPVGTYPLGTSPFGTLRNNPGDNSGTPVDVNLVEDILIFAEALMAIANITPNNIVDTNAIPQLLQALDVFIAAGVLPETSRALAAEALLASLVQLAAETTRAEAAEAAIGTGWQSITTGLTITATGGTITGSTYTFNYVVIGKTLLANIKLVPGTYSTSPNPPSAINIQLPNGMTFASAGTNLGFMEGQGNLGAANWTTGATNNIIAMSSFNNAYIGTTSLMEFMITGQIN
jgi:hypothetical protein